MPVAARTRFRCCARSPIVVMAEILVWELRAQAHPQIPRTHRSARQRLRARRHCLSSGVTTGRKPSPGFPIVFDCSAHCFFHCSPLFPRRRIFSSLHKALHCNWAAFSIVDRLYFSRKIFRRRARRRWRSRDRATSGIYGWRARPGLRCGRAHRSVGAG